MDNHSSRTSRLYSNTLFAGCSNYVPTEMEGLASPSLHPLPGAQWETNHFTGTKLFMDKS
jgi:hypothetical protein